MSNFYTYSRNVGKYWVEPWELFARGFETYIFDKLESKGRANNYLVSDDFHGSDYRVYPYGMEREDLFILYDELFKVIKREYEWPDFNDLGRPRVDEYIELGENKKGEETSEGIITDTDSNEVVIDINQSDSERRNNVLKKLKEFYELL